jgi:hypothetical protein
MEKLTDVVTLRQITVDTVDDVLGLRVSPDQEGCVATNAKSIAQAHYYPGVAWFRRSTPKRPRSGS